MSNSNAYFESHPESAERRIYARRPISTLEYVELDEGNGGIILNASIGGLSVQAVTSLMDDLLPVVRFRPTQSRDWIETSARIAWADESRKIAGLEFQNLSDHTRIQIKKWLSNEAPASQFLSDPDHEIERLTSSTPVSIRQDQLTNKPELPIVAAGPVPQNATAIHAVQKGTPAESSTPALPAASPSAGDAFGATFRSSFGQAREIRREPGIRNKESAEEPTGVYNRPALVAILAVLAVVSLVIGWEAGHGALSQGFRILLNTMSPDKSAGLAPAPHSSRPAAGITEIEVVDATSQRWVIPFDGGAATPTVTAPLPTSSGSVSQARKSAPAFQTWVLSPPVHTSNSSNTAVNDKETPPTVGDISNPEDRLSPPSGLTSSASPPPPLVTRAALKPGILIYRVDPIYPKLAQEHSITGTVNLRVTVAEDGTVRDIEVVSGLGVFIDAATSAVRRWRYTPALLDGKPVEMVREISLAFRPPPAPR